ncbi:MAG: hypothetical protein AB2689_09800 [Candidatus Thiodiazotropha taylori]
MIKTIPNKELKVEFLPSTEDRKNIFKFAMLFNGYEHYGSLEDAGKIARAKSRESISEIRNELFFSARASRHSDDDRYLDVYREILPILKQKIENGENT